MIKELTGLKLNFGCNIIHFIYTKGKKIRKKVQLINVNKKLKKVLIYFGTKKGRTYPLVKISFLKDIDSRNTVFYAATSHLAELYCLMCSCGVIISNGLLSLSIANIMLHTL